MESFAFYQLDLDLSGKLILCSYQRGDLQFLTYIKDKLRHPVLLTLIVVEVQTIHKRILSIINTNRVHK